MASKQNRFKYWVRIIKRCTLRVWRNADVKGSDVIIEYLNSQEIMSDSEESAKDEEQEALEDDDEVEVSVAMMFFVALH